MILKFVLWQVIISDTQIMDHGYNNLMAFMVLKEKAARYQVA